MTPLEAILKVKSMFAEVGSDLPVAQAEPVVSEPSAPATEQSKEYVLKSGAKVMIDKLEVGGHVSVVDEAGNESPAPAGEHELADGMKVYVDDMGVISAIEPVEVESPVNEEMEAAKSQIVALQSQIEELKAKIDQSEAAQLEAAQKFSKGISDLSDVVVGLINTASAQATEKPTEQAFSHTESKEDKIKRFLALAKSVK